MIINSENIHSKPVRKPHIFTNYNHKQHNKKNSPKGEQEREREKITPIITHTTLTR